MNVLINKELLTKNGIAVLRLGREFISKAPKSVVDGERKKGDKYRGMLKTVMERLESLK